MTVQYQEMQVRGNKRWCFQHPPPANVQANKIICYFHKNLQQPAKAPAKDEFSSEESENFDDDDSEEEEEDSDFEDPGTDHLFMTSYKYRNCLNDVMQDDK